VAKKSFDIFAETRPRLMTADVLRLKRNENVSEKMAKKVKKRPKNGQKSEKNDQKMGKKVKKTTKKWAKSEKNDQKMGKK
jgi:hypothetical protein